VLRGVDGIVFVADSQYSKMSENVESFANMEENLRTLKMNLADIPTCCNTTSATCRAWRRWNTEFY